MTGIFIIARLGSTRLQQKHLIQVGGKSFLEWLVARYNAAFQEQINNSEAKIFVVTSEKAGNEKLEQLFAGKTSPIVFYGSDNNIPLRQLQCARTNNITEIISVDGDDILCSTQAAIEVRKVLLQSVMFAKTVGLPLGMNVVGYQTQFLEESLKDRTESTLETGWGRIFDYAEVKEIRLGKYHLNEHLRLTLDYEADAQLFAAIIDAYGDEIITAGDRSIIEFILTNKLYELNKDVNDIYWQNFNCQKKKESKSDDK